MKWYINVIKNYAVFKGRARRKEYWMFYLFNILIIFAFAFLASALDSDFIFSIIAIYYIFIIIPSISVTVRRLHDIGYSGWMILINLIPFVGGIILFVLTCLDSQPNDNQHGPNPKRFNSDIVDSSPHAREYIFCENCDQKTPIGKFCVKCGKELGF